MSKASDPLLNEAPAGAELRSGDQEPEPPRQASVSSVSSRSTRMSVSVPPTEAEFEPVDEKQAQKYQEKYLRPRWHWAVVLMRLAFFLTAGALVGISFYVALTAGQVHSQKIYAAVIVSGILAMCADVFGAIVLFRKPRAAPIIAVVDAVVILLGAIGIPSILFSEYATEWDQIACILQGVVISERLVSIIVGMSICYLDSRKRDSKMRPTIMRRRVSMQEGFTKLSQLPGGPVSGKSSRRTLLTPVREEELEEGARA